MFLQTQSNTNRKTMAGNKRPFWGFFFFCPVFANHTKSIFTQQFLNAFHPIYLYPLGKSVHSKYQVSMIIVIDDIAVANR